MSAQEWGPSFAYMGQATNLASGLFKARRGQALMGFLDQNFQAIGAISDAIHKAIERARRDALVDAVDAVGPHDPTGQAQAAIRALVEAPATNRWENAPVTPDRSAAAPCPMETRPG
jgi:hypothetical protein